MHSGTPDRLAAILAYKAKEVDALLAQVPIETLKRRALAAPPPRDFEASLRNRAARDENALICEIKRRSPSAGAIRSDASAEATALAYEAGGAACLSVLTDGPSFGGSLADLASVRAKVNIPCLRKDFMIHIAQVLEARSAGADAILVILAAVDDLKAAELEQAALDLGMAVLLEVHDADELERALRLQSALIGVNNRNLKTFTTDLSVTEQLATSFDGSRLLISESGVRDPADLVRLRASGVRAFLIGETLMRAADPGAMVSGLVTVR
ncbi:indole-3-glycerol phosphate synthase TrpC [bacterium]|nr:indole-3-glycerol phosphate synthase TrpC [bacterium]